MTFKGGVYPEPLLEFGGGDDGDVGGSLFGDLLDDGDGGFDGRGGL